MGTVDELAAIARRLEAGERLDAYMDMAAAAGNLKKHAHRAHIRDLRRQARGPADHRQEDEVTRSHAETSAADPSSVGIGVTMVPKVLGAVPRAADA